MHARAPSGKRSISLARREVDHQADHRRSRAVGQGDNAMAAHLQLPGDGGRRARGCRRLRDGLAVVVGHQLGAGVNQAQREVGFAGARRSANQDAGAVDGDTGSVEESIMAGWERVEPLRRGASIRG